MRKLFIVLFLALAGTIANAETELISSVNPLVVMGFEINKPLGLPSCADDGKDVEQLCVSLPTISGIVSQVRYSYNTIAYPKSESPSYMLSERVSAIVIDKRLVGLDAHLKDYESTKAYLISKLGNPTEVSEHGFVKTAIWIMGNDEIFVELSAVKESLDVAKLNIRTIEYVDATFE